jgi:hypothetical protein
MRRATFLINIRRNYWVIFQFQVDLIFLSQNQIKPIFFGTFLVNLNKKLVLFNQEKKRAECLDELSSEKNLDVLEENILMSDNEKQISFDNDFGNLKAGKKNIEFDLVDAADILNLYGTQKEREKQDEEKLLDEIIQTNDLS